jgi:hypothetical protein
MGRRGREVMKKTIYTKTIARDLRRGTREEGKGNGR